ncbi:FAD-dependent monooxygenase [Gordonia rhizosphera]|uniref:Putative oxidoreductase n=1 Tax=Gordonia rhizosphera NBRC 16068 TaxID=1108045 RepID=K6WES1_9ACTN|nr:FAD-dependent monooxygenase [Gordonia rhizosphera]GAB90682.1 putative oxidoreductase [Gordonia rhizosphera NBRC 16068]
MKLTRIAVLGGGPGGLYAARLLKLRHPDANVVVYEQSSPDTTFGFGVGLASRTQRNLRDADSASLDEIVDASWPHEMSMQVNGNVARISHGELLAIGRTDLLAVLQKHARHAGVELRFGERRRPAEVDADLVIAADGINSAARQDLIDDFRPHIDTGAGLYLWCGTDFALPSAVFTPVTTEHGTFVAHAYPYASDRSTFLIETDETTWRNAGFDVTTDQTAPQDSDEKSLKYLQDAFVEALDGHPLIGNRTRWMRFRTVSCERWHTGNVVLLGDSAHTAHYSIGSGTKLAMEDAIALDRAIASAATLEDALDTYERVRRPDVEYLQEIAVRSELWWESFPARTDLPVEQLMLAYMTRAGKVSVEHFLEYAPDVARRGLAAYAGVSAEEVPGANGIEAWVLRQPLDHRGQQFASRRAQPTLHDDPETQIVDVRMGSAWSPDADALVADPPECRAIWLTGDDTRTAVLTRLDLAERLTHTTDALIIVEAPHANHSDLVAGLVSARTHLVSLTTATSR